MREKIITKYKSVFINKHYFGLTPKKKCPLVYGPQQARSLSFRNHLHQYYIAFKSLYNGWLNSETCLHGYTHVSFLFLTNKSSSACF